VRFIDFARDSSEVSRIFLDLRAARATYLVEDRIAGGALASEVEIFVKLVVMAVCRAVINFGDCGIVRGYGHQFPYGVFELYCLGWKGHKFGFLEVKGERGVTCWRWKLLGYHGKGMLVALEGVSLRDFSCEWKLLLEHFH